MGLFNVSSLWDEEGVTFPVLMLDTEAGADEGGNIEDREYG